MMTPNTQSDRSQRPIGHTLGRRLAGLALATSLILACATAPDPPATGRATLFGQLQLIPRPGVNPGHAGGGAYASPAMRDVTFVDYTRPGFAVVYAEGTPPRASVTHLAIRRSALRVRLDPDYSATGVNGAIAVVNETAELHVVSDPSAGIVRALEPGATLTIEPLSDGLHSIYLLDSADATAHVFVAPGPYAVVSERGHFELPNLPPGVVQVHAFHPRFPPVARVIDLPPNEATRVDLQMGVALPDGMAHESR